MSKIKPLGDKILVEILEAEEKTEGGIFLPDTAKEEKSEGKFVSVGDSVSSRIAFARCCSAVQRAHSSGGEFAMRRSVERHSMMMRSMSPVPKNSVTQRDLLSGSL